MGVTHCSHCPGSHTGGSPCSATAPAANAWLLIEHPGPWTYRIDEMDLADPIVDALARARTHGVRPQLIRPPRRRRSVPPFRVFVGWSASGEPAGGRPPWFEGRELADAAELSELDLAAVSRGHPPRFGVPVPEPILLVCAHGRRNTCCARNGAPLARALRSRFGDAVWETTHVGGDRYAANLVCLPHGLYYGDLSVSDALAAVRAYRNGRVTLDHYRGRAGLPDAAQAAEHFLRSRTGVLGVDEVTVESLTGTSIAEAVLRSGLRRYRVRVERLPVAACGPACTESITDYVLRGLTLLNRVALV